MSHPQPLRSLVIVLGDQLDLQSSAFDDFDAAQDAVWMAEVADESTHVWSAKQRIVIFLAAMRHFAQALRAAGRNVYYTPLDSPDNTGVLAQQLACALRDLRPTQLVMTAPGDWRTLQALKAAAATHSLPLEIRDDRHFYSTVREFAAHARARKQLRMEYFYREMRQKHNVLMEGKKPVGGQWNFDADNREAFAKTGPVDVPQRVKFAPDKVTCEVIALVQEKFSDHPGRLEEFAWAVTRPQALHALEIFIRERLPQFGLWQDALWPDQPWL